MKILLLLLAIIQVNVIGSRAFGNIAFAGENKDAFKYGTYNAQMKLPTDGEVFTSKKTTLPIEHKKYVEPVNEMENLEIVNYDEYNPEHQKEVKVIVEKLRQNYRHVALKDQVPQLSYVEFKYLYALPTVVNNYQSKVVGSTTIQKSAIEVFNSITANNGTQLLLDKRSFGLGGSYGRVLSKRATSEWEVVFYQKAFSQTDSSTTGISVNYDYTDSSGAPQVGTLKYTNVEYIQRNIALTYSRHLAFLNFFGESSSARVSKLVPYIIFGGGAISRWNFLRFSTGALGTTSSAVSDLTTDESMFGFMPAFVYGLGVRYALTDTLQINGQFKSTQPINDINIQNYVVYTGLRIYF